MGKHSVFCPANQDTRSLHDPVTGVTLHNIQIPCSLNMFTSYHITDFVRALRHANRRQKSSGFKATLMRNDVHYDRALLYTERYACTIRRVTGC
jgi:hypothetical protein